MSITLDLIISSVGTSQKKKPTESIEEYLERIVHLSLNEKNIETLEGLEGCVALKVLYLRSNILREISHLNFPSLTHLDLQYNFIKKIEGLQGCPSLTHLYLNFNHITEIVSLEGPTNLQELHLSYQKRDNKEGDTDKDEPFVINDEVLDPVANSLCVLSIAGVGLNSLNVLWKLFRLHTLDASDNPISDWDSVSDFLMSSKFLRKLSLNNTPLASQPKFHEMAITYSNSVTSVNGKDVIPTQREFCRRLFIRKHAGGSRGTTSDSERKSERGERKGSSNQSLHLVGQQPPSTTERHIASSSSRVTVMGSSFATPSPSSSSSSSTSSATPEFSDAPMSFPPMKPSSAPLHQRQLSTPLSISSKASASSASSRGIGVRPSPSSSSTAHTPPIHYPASSSQARRISYPSSSSRPVISDDPLRNHTTSTAKKEETMQFGLSVSGITSAENSQKMQK